MNDDDKKEAIVKILRKHLLGSNAFDVSKEILKVVSDNSNQVEEKPKTRAEEWEEQRLAHWNQLQDARTRYHTLFAFYKDQGYEKSNPYEGKD